MEKSDYSIHCNLRGGDCYNPTCMLNGKCVDFINRESYLKWKDEECQKAIRATERLRMMDAASAINEANELRAQIKELTKDKERLDWIQQMMTPDDNYIEIFFAGLRNFKEGKATSFQIESGPWEKFQSLSAPTLREAIDLAIQKCGGVILNSKTPDEPSTK